MSLSAKDQTQILNWFEEKQKHENTTDEYFKYRDLIFTLALKQLNDYFTILKAEWRKKFHLSEDDCVSIIHDGLLAAVDNFKLHFQSKSGVKFITYLTTVLRNLATTYARRNHIQYENSTGVRKPRNAGRIPSSLYVSLDTILKGLDDHDNLQVRDADMKFAAPLLKVLEQQEGVIDSQVTQRLVVENLLGRLSVNDKHILQSVMDGRNLSDIAKDLDVTAAGIKYRLKRLSKKLDGLKQELWPSAKQ